MGEKVAFIGLGVMGFPMAGHLAAKGHAVTVFNRTRAKADAWLAKHRGRAAATPADAASGALAVFVCVGNDDDVRAVTLGQDGALAGMSKGSVLVDHTTSSAELARALEKEAARHGVGFVDAPVSGGQSGAEKGILTVMCGGAPVAFERARPFIETYARAVNLMGGAGAGQLTKMVNQICIAGLIEGLAEGLHFAECAGLDAKAVVDVISKGAAQSWQMDNRAMTMIEGKFNFGFAVDWMRKDLALCLAEAGRNGAALPVAALVDKFYAEVQSLGGSRWDTSSLIARLRSLRAQKSSSAL
jgi:3-hydroxyisobutyrate dehydrogenase-like beta-hydroxyacid dehydrogenase